METAVKDHRASWHIRSVSLCSTESRLVISRSANCLACRVATATCRIAVSGTTKCRGGGRLAVTRDVIMRPAMSEYHSPSVIARSMASLSSVTLRVLHEMTPNRDAARAAPLCCGSVTAEIGLISPTTHSYEICLMFDQSNPMT